MVVLFRKLTESVFSAGYAHILEPHKSPAIFLGEKSLHCMFEGSTIDFKGLTVAQSQCVRMNNCSF